MLAALQDRPLSLVVALGLGSLYVLFRLVQNGITGCRHYLFARRRGCKSARSYPHRDPIFGFDLFFENMKLSKRGGLLAKMADRYEDIGAKTYTQLILGRRMYTTSEPENIKAILATQFKDFGLTKRRKSAFEPVFGHGIFTTDGKDWEASRALLRPSFTRSQVGDIETFEIHVSKLLKKLPRDGSTVDLQALFFLLTLDSATDFLFGHSTNALDETDPSSPGIRFGDAFNYVTERVGHQSRVGKLATIIPNKKYKEDVAYVHEYVDMYVKKAVQLHQKGLQEENGEMKLSDRYIFLEHLAKTGYPERKIRDELLNILTAGRDTTASLLAFLFYFLARRPDVWQKLRVEVLELGDKRPTFEDIKSMKYLQWCIHETLRVQPIVPINARVALRDTTLPVGGGPDEKSPVFVKAGQVVSYQPYVMHRRKDFYGEDADEFKPERWQTLRPSWQYLPFNGGPRICIGQQFALTEASYTTIRILQTFKSIEKREDSELAEWFILTSAVRAGTQVSLTPA